jgi:hypothetical protein
MNRRTTLASVGIVALAALFLAPAFSQKQEVQEPSRNPALEEAYWRERIQSVGGSGAYKELAQSVEGKTPESEHTSAHAFGAALYEEKGKEGLSVCDAHFNFGCYHEFLGRAIAAEGLAVAASLNEGCFSALTESPLSCQHGIGHGILSYIGYGEKQLRQGLEECEKIPYADPIGGCYGGLFMEYNLQTMLATQARLRPLGVDPLAPCNVLKETYRAACYYWQPQWWAQALKPTLEGSEAFKTMGAWCALSGAYVRECFEGIGNIATPEANFSPVRAKELCEASSTNRTERLYCKSIAANSLFLGGAGMKGDGLSVCKGLETEAYAYCAAYAKNEANILYRASPPLQ